MAKNNTPKPEDATLEGGIPLGEISQEPPAFELFLERNQGKLIILAIILAVGALGYLVFDGINQSHEKNAGAQLIAADTTESLQKITADFPNTAAAFSAGILIAEDQWDTDEKEEAIATLEKLIESGGDHPAMANALASYGSKKLANGDIEAAKNAFEDLLATPNSEYLAGYAQLKLGDIALKKGDQKAAEDAYLAVSQSYADSLFVNRANQRLQVVRAVAPTVVELPKVEEDETSKSEVEETKTATSAEATQTTAVEETPTGEQKTEAEADAETKVSE